MRVQEALAETELPLEIRSHYATSLHKVLRSLTPEALARHHANTKGFRFYSSPAELTEAFLAKYPNARQVVKKDLKAAFDTDGILHLNGASGSFDRLGIREIYAHEITHSIDGNEHEISDSSSWRDAWNAERCMQSTNGKKNPKEGLAEFGQWLLGSGLRREQMRQLMPKCLEAWEGYNL
jgi:hypothetical protein